MMCGVLCNDIFNYPSVKDYGCNPSKVRLKLLQVKENCYCNIFVRFIFSILCSWTVVQSGSCAAPSEGKNHTTLPDAFMAGANFTIQRCKILQFSSPEPQGKDIDKPSLNTMGFPIILLSCQEKVVEHTFTGINARQ